MVSETDSIVNYERGKRARLIDLFWIDAIRVVEIRAVAGSRCAGQEVTVIPVVSWSSHHTRDFETLIALLSQTRHGIA